MQELLALMGVAAGVALLFAVQVANTSITGSLSQLAHGITGRASLEVAARGTAGMDQAIVAQVQKIEGVRGAAPILEQRINVVGPRGSAPLTIAGVDKRLQRIGGPLVRRFTAKRKDLDALGFYLTAPAAKKIGVAPGRELIVEAGANRRTVILAGTLDADEIGDLAKSPVALAPLGTVQRLVGMPGRISRVLVEPETGNGTDVARDLRVLAAGRLNVRASDAEVSLLGEALKPDQQSSALFSVIAVVIGLLFAYNAMLLALARRRRQVAYLRMVGADRATVLVTLIFEALVLGFVASLVGIALGDLLSRLAFQSIPEYLAAGFTIGAQRIIDFQTVALSIVGGLVAALLASAKPAIDLFRVEAAEAVHESRSVSTSDDSEWGSKVFWTGLLTVVLSSALAFLWPVATPVGIVGLFAGLVLVLGPILAWVIVQINRVTRVRGGVGFAIAVDELKGNPARATALALIVAGAMLALVSIGGTRLDLERGVDRLTSGYFGTSDLWVASASKTNVFVTQQFDQRSMVERLNKQPDIRSADVAQWTFLDFEKRRVLVVSRPPTDPHPLVRSQIVQGDPEIATQRIRSGGWVALSTAVANEHDYRLGDRVSIPTPTGSVLFKLAAITANHGWPSGSVVMNGSDYNRAWDSDTTSAIAVRLSPRVSNEQGKRIVASVLGADSALSVRTAREMVSDRSHAFAQGLARLRQISTLVLGASILAIISAMFAAVWQRRSRLASLRAIGMYRSEVYRSLFAETGLIVFLGGVGGLICGLYGQGFLSRWTAMVTGYRTPFSPALGLSVATLAEILILAIIATAGPAFLASRVLPKSG